MNTIVSVFGLLWETFISGFALMWGGLWAGFLFLAIIFNVVRGVKYAVNKMKENT